MMTDINIWDARLSPGQVSSWTRCEEEPDLEESRVVGWDSASWRTERVEVVRLEREELCYRETEEKVFMFKVERKDFYQSADFCHLLQGHIALPRDEEDLQDLESKCSGFTGWNDIEEEGQFVDPYTNQAMGQEVLWNNNEPNNYGGREDCTDVRWSRLNDENCDTTKSCVLCSLANHPQLQLRGMCSYQDIDVRYSWQVREEMKEIYQLEGWDSTTLRWESDRWELFHRSQQRVIAVCNDSREYPLGHHR